MSDVSKGKILIIEDDASFRRVYRDMLDTAGYNVLVAEDGEAGWDLVKSEKPSLVLLDLVLPGLHGFEVLKYVRDDAETRDIPVIVMTALGEQGDIRKGLELGANDYLVKGFFTPREILSKVRALFTQAEMRKGVTSYKLSVKEGRAEAAKLQTDIGLTKLFTCPHCEEEILLELIPDYTRTDSHWFLSHFVCPKCQRSF
ncbi:MAG: response regulator [Chloroflexota bacterium]|nr:response regulator [Chloroflexota bacterium]